jgi:hypothetical protein
MKKPAATRRKAPTPPPSTKTPPTRAKAKKKATETTDQRAKRPARVASKPTKKRAERPPISSPPSRGLGTDRAKRARTTPSATKRAKPAKATPRKAPARRTPAPAPRSKAAPVKQSKKAAAAQRTPVRARPASSAKPKAQPARRPAAKAPRKPTRAPARKPKISKSPAAIAARKRRAEQRGIEEQKRATRNERRRKRRLEKSGKVDERTLAEGWLEHIRDDLASITPTSLEITEPEVGAKTPWMIVGRFDFHELIDYATLADALDVVANDVLLEAKVHPQRLSQIRVVYNDPKSKRGEGDSIVSKIGAWEFIIGDLIGEIAGGGPEDEGSLAVRYAETKIPTIYIYFSSEITSHRTVAPWQTTQTIKLKKG